MTLPFPFAHSEAVARFGEQSGGRSGGGQGDRGGSWWVLLTLPFSLSTMILFPSWLD